MARYGKDGNERSKRIEERRKGRGGKRPQKKRGDENIVSLLFSAIGAVVRHRLKHMNKAFKHVNLGLLDDYKSLIFTIAGVVVLAGIISMFWAMTNKNANEVFVNGKPIGFVKADKTVTPESVKTMVTNVLTSRLGTEVKLENGIEFKPAHAQKKKLLTNDALLNMLSTNLKYKVKADVITYDGGTLTLKNDNETNDLKDRLCAEYIDPNAVIIEKNVLGMEVANAFVDESEITTVDLAYGILSAKKAIENTYNVKSGDYLQKIALMYDMSVDELCRINGIVPEDSKNLKAGQQLTVIVNKPMFDVRVIEEISHNEPVAPNVVKTENPTKPKSYMNTVDAGADGEDKVTERVSYLNGTEESREVVGRENILPAKDKVVEVGNK
ncbi:hypothetical protein AGMMS49975_04940 [Clostridia bacterium]|nr:hypothetical protein AGMMS49975_04940 [Clostridia bacterium]